MSTTATKEAPFTTTDSFPLLGTDYVELYVGNARQAAHFYQSCMGFQPLAYAGLSTGLKDRESYVVVQDKIRLVLTSPLTNGTEIGRLHDLHGDTVRCVALWVDDATVAYETAVSRGAESVMLPTASQDDHGTCVRAQIQSFGNTIHEFVERKNYDGPFLPGYDADVMDFKQLISFDDKDISTKYTALMSKVMSNGNGRVKFPINEPAPGLKKSQIEEYLDFHKGPGIQHIAVATDDVIGTVRALRARGMEFLRVPDSYYDTLLDRVGNIDEDISPLRELGILVDRDDEGYLLQIFTKPVQPRPTVFFEIIQRKGATSFGKGNFKALFEAIEREQELRGTL